MAYNLSINSLIYKILFIIVLSVCIHGYDNSFTILRKSRQDMKTPTDSSAISAVLGECADDAEKSKCQRKLLINIRINPFQNSRNNQTFAIIDEVYNAEKRTEEKLFSPLLIQIQRTESILMYPLNHSLTVPCGDCNNDLVDENKNTKKLYEEDDINAYFLNKRNDAVDEPGFNNKEQKLVDTIEKFVNKTGGGPVEFRPEIKNNIKENIHQAENVKNYNRIKLPPVRKLPQRPILNQVVEFERSEKYSNFPTKNEIPFSPDLQSDYNELFLKNRGNHATSDDKRKRTKSIHKPRSSNYEVYDINNPLPLLVTEIRVFQRRDDEWFKLGPSTSLSTLSKNKAKNSNVLITLSSNDDLFPTKRHTLLEDYQLFLPSYISHVALKADKRDTSLKLSREPLLIFNSNKLKKISKKHNKRKHIVEKSETSNLTNRLCQMALCETKKINDEKKRNSYEKFETERDGKEGHQFYSNNDRINKSIKSSNLDISSLDNNGRFSNDIDIIDKCKHNKKHLCLNMPNNELPVYSVKIQFPFNEKELIPNNYYKIRIMDIVTDATKSGILKVNASVINVGFIGHEFDIYLDNCLAKGDLTNRTVIKKYLLPNIGKNVNFEINHPHHKRSKELHCQISVKTKTEENPFIMKTIAKRKFSVKREMRCLCLGKCNCNCLRRSSLHHSKGDYNCHRMKRSATFEAGFNIYQEVNKVSYVATISLVVFFLFLLALLLGFIKALIGLISPKIRNFGYNRLQPGRQQDSKSRHFCINILFFICIPFTCSRCIRRLCSKSEEENLLIENYDFELIQHEICQNSDDESFQRSNSTSKSYTDMTDEDETIFDQFNEQRSEISSSSSKPESSQRSRGGGSNQSHDIKYKNTEDGHIEDDINDTDLEDKEAALYVGQLLESKIVFRRFFHPVGGVRTDEYQQYSIRGFFMVDIGRQYKFVTPIPARQYIRICPEDLTLRKTPIPRLLNSNALSQTYKDRKDVYRKGDLFLQEPGEAPCLNIQRDKKKLISFPPTESFYL